MRLILIRHGQSHHSQRRLIADINGCLGLTPEGFEQAKLLANRFRLSSEVKDCRTLLCSPILRAQQTAQVLAEAFPALTMQQEDGLREIHPGDADGLIWPEYEAKFGAFDLVAEPDRPFAPKGESWRQFLNRVQATLERLAGVYEDQTVIAVTHAGFIVASILVLFDIPRPGTGAYLEPSHTSLTEWRKLKGVWQLAKYNETGHLVILGSQ